MNEMTRFVNNELDCVLRVTDIEGATWFIAQDACNAIGIPDQNQSTRSLDDDEKGMFTIHTPGGPQSVTIISEAGLYSLILRSRKPEAKVFKRWITHEVLPSIRKHGAYITPDKIQEMLKDPAFVTSTLKTLEATQAKCKVAEELYQREQTKRQAAERVIEHNQTKVDCYDTIVNSVGYTSMEEVAKILSIKNYGRKKIFAFLRSEPVKVLMGNNNPYQKYINRECFTVVKVPWVKKSTGKTHTTPKTLASLKGIDLIRKLLIDYGVVTVDMKLTEKGKDK